MEITKDLIEQAKLYIIEEEKEKLYSIIYCIDDVLKSDLDILMDIIGQDKRIILSDCTQTRFDKLTFGEINIEFDENHKYDYDILLEYAIQLYILRCGKSLEV